MTQKVAKADVTPVRQRTQYTCMSTSLMMCLQALGYDVNEDEVNKVMGARPMKGAAWEQALAAAQHFGVRGTLTTPSTVRQLKEWTDLGKPVMIAWNPEGREWSHASVVFDVTPSKEHGFDVHVADPNIPDPDETVRVMPKSEFYKKWYEKWPNYLVRRPALMLDREITPDGRQVMASRGWKKTLVSWSKEYKTPEGENLGAMIIDRGKVNWRPNQLIEGFVRPQVISRSRSGEEIPSNEKLTSVADAWVRKNTRSAGWKTPINLPSLDSLKLRSLGKGTHPKVLERRVQDIGAYLAKGMSPERAVRQWFKDNGDRLPEDYPKSPRGTDMQLKSMAQSLYKQLTGIATGLDKAAGSADPSRVAAAHSRTAGFGIHKGLKEMAAKMESILDEYGVMGGAVKPFNSGYEGVKVDLPGWPGKQVFYFDQPGVVGLEDQSPAYISLEVDRRNVFKKTFDDRKFGEVQFPPAEKKRINKQVLDKFRQVVEDVALGPKAASAARVASRYAPIGDAALWAGRRKPTPEEVEAVKNTKGKDWDNHPLPDDPSKFFKRTSDMIVVDLPKLVPIHARDKGIVNANRRMWLAYWGEMPKRDPLYLRQSSTGTYIVIDGNSTYFNAKRSGWKKMWGVLLPKPPRPSRGTP